MHLLIFVTLNDLHLHYFFVFLTLYYLKSFVVFVFLFQFDIKLLYLLLDVTAAEVAELDAATCARVLAFNERGRALLKKISAPVVTKVTKHLNRRDLYERRRKLDPYQKILLLDVLATDLRGILFETPRPPQADFSTPPQFVT